MPIAQLGATNVSALNVPQPLVQIVPPQYLFGGVPTNVTGLVGTASWGPVNLPQTFGSYSQYASIFGPTINRTNDIGGHVLLAQYQGAAYFSGVRVTDGTDAAATATVTSGVFATGTYTFTTNPTSGTVVIGGTTVTIVASGAVGSQINSGANVYVTLANLLSFLQLSIDTNLVKATYSVTGLVLTVTYYQQGTAGNSFTTTSTVTGCTVSGATLAGGAVATTGFTATAHYTGTLGNSIKIILQNGSKASSYKIIISAPGLTTEVFDNIGATLSGNALWIAIVAAINNGSSSQRPSSNIITASVGAGTNAPLLGVATTLSGGTDGVGSIVSSTLLGVDAAPRTGMYALRNQQVAQFTLCDLSDSTAFTVINAFALDIGAEGVQATPASDTISNVATTLSTAGIDSYGITVLFGDWILWNDTVNGVPTRMTSPAAIKLGKLGNLSPEQSALNKPLYGIVQTQSQALGKTYSYADYQALALARVDVITIDKTISNNYICRLGINTSSNAVTMDDSYTRLINFIAKSLLVIVAYYIGTNITPDQMRRAKISINSFLALLQQNGVIGTIDGSQPYQTVLDLTNNSQTTAALGFEYAYVKVVFWGIARYFIVNLEGGASVTISNTQPGYSLSA